jgi:hypothetical protein
MLIVIVKLLQTYASYEQLMEEICKKKKKNNNICLWICDHFETDVLTVTYLCDFVGKLFHMWQTQE